jgi:hypothetical protein
MTMHRRSLLKLASGLTAVTLASHALGHRPRPSRVRRDVCILGGGSSGTHAALRLRDLGSSVALVERTHRLGGHAQTYFDDASGVPINIGVVVFENVELVRDYFARLNVSAIPADFSGPPPLPIDFSTGRLVEDYAPPDPAAAGAALYAYRQILAQKLPYLDDGFELPARVPEDLAMPFGRFVEKYSLQALFPTVFLFGQGLGDILAAPSIYVLKNFSAAVVDSILGTGFLTVPAGVSTIYDGAALELGSDVLYESKVLSVERGCRGQYPISVKLSTPEGEVVVESKKLLVAFPPSPKGFASFDFTGSERSLFSSFRPNHYSTGVVRLSGISDATTLQNTGNRTPYALPSLPGVYALSPTGAPGLWNVKYGSPTLLEDRAVQQAIARDVRRIARAGSAPVSLEGFAIFRNHSPFELMASSREVASGFYRRVNGLQGFRDTFYTGATFQTHDSSLIWRFNESLLPKMFT